MIDQIKELIVKNQTLSNNSCGTTILYLMNETKLSYNEIIVFLKQLHSEKLIVFKKGINHDLIFLKQFTKKR
jgi:hypothetical protein